MTFQQHVGIMTKNLKDEIVCCFTSLLSELFAISCALGVCQGWHGFNYVRLCFCIVRYSRYVFSRPVSTVNLIYCVYGSARLGSGWLDSSRVVFGQLGSGRQGLCCGELCQMVSSSLLDRVAYAAFLAWAVVTYRIEVAHWLFHRLGLQQDVA